MILRVEIILTIVGLMRMEYTLLQIYLEEEVVVPNGIL